MIIEILDIYWYEWVCMGERNLYRDLLRYLKEIELRD